MMHESDIDHRTGSRPRREATIPAASLAGMLPAGWICLQDCDISGIPGRAVPMHFVLLHAEIGAALLDIAPAATQGAEATLRRRLDAARFEGIFPGNLPVVHLRIAPDETASLGDLLEQAFASLPPLSVAGGDAWLSVVCRALSPRDPSRGATYRGMHAEDWAAATPPVAPARSHSVSAHSGPPPHRGRAATPPVTPDWDEDAADEAALGTTGDRPRRRLPWRLLAAGAGGLAMIATVVLLASGGPSAEVPSVAQQGTAQWDAPRTPLALGSGGGAAPGSATIPANPTPVPAAGMAAPMGPRLAPQPAPPRPADGSPLRAEAAPTGPNGTALAGSAAPMRAAEPPAPPPPEQVSRIIVTSAVNLRSGPAKTFAVVRTAPRGEVLRVHDRAPGNWIQVGEAQPEGWLFGELVRDVRP